MGGSINKEAPSQKQTKEPITYKYYENHTADQQPGANHSRYTEVNLTSEVPTIHQASCSSKKCYSKSIQVPSNIISHSRPRTMNKSKMSRSLETSATGRPNTL